MEERDVIGEFLVAVDGYVIKKNLQKDDRRQATPPKEGVKWQKMAPLNDFINRELRVIFEVLEHRPHYKVSKTEFSYKNNTGHILPVYKFRIEKTEKSANSQILYRLRYVGSNAGGEFDRCEPLNLTIKSDNLSPERGLQLGLKIADWVTSAAPDRIKEIQSELKKIAKKTQK